MEQWYQKSVEEYIEQWASNVPENPRTGKRGLQRLLEEGAWEGDREPFYEPYNVALSDADMQGANIDEATGVITKDGVGVGIVKDGKPVCGFATPSRRFEVHSLFIQKIGNNENCSELIAASGVTKTKNRPDNHGGHDLDIDPMPIWFQPQEHRELADDELVMTSFKWNVYNRGRTMNLKWLAEMVLSNPAWINPQTAARFGLNSGDWIEVTSYYSQELAKQSPHLKRDDLPQQDGRRVVATMRVPVVLIEGIHPRALAMSNSCGHWQYTSVAQAKRDKRSSLEATNGSTGRPA